MSEDYVELGRLFAALKPDEIVTAALVDSWGLGLSGAVGWDAVIERRCVVVLAEAGNGKSKEFQEQARKLTDAGKFGFYATIETVFDVGLAISLGPDASRMRAWLESREEAWFFLDSVDEARLNQKSFETALARVAAELGPAYRRAHISISCRGSEWAGAADVAVIQRYLPPPAQDSESEPAIEGEEALYRPLGEKKHDSQKTEKVPAASGPAVNVMRLLGLTRAQRKAFLVASGVSDPDAFERELDLSRLSELAERPGDLKLLVAYWKEHSKFGSLTEMMELAILDRLKERQKRADAGYLSEEKARRGAERLAAALTLCQTTSIRIPLDEDARKGGLDATLVLPDWNADERKALLTRAVFAPATTGFVRFHHRSAQEYLTARWFYRLVEEGAPLSAVMRLFMADRHGVATVPPLLRAAAVWLSQWLPDLREVLLQREPLTLLKQGDPSRLRHEDKARLLTEYARRDLTGDLTDGFIDHRALYMFADESLAGSIRDAWAANSDIEFRHDLVRMIGQGAIKDCADLAAEYAMHSMGRRDYQRVAAVDALSACGDLKRMGEVARAMLAKPEQLEANFAPLATVLMFPKVLSLDDVLKLMAKSKPAGHYDSAGFGQVLRDLYKSCASKAEREKFLTGVAALCFEPPLREYPALSLRHAELSRHLEPLAREAIVRSDHDGVGPGLVRLLMACERADGFEAEAGPALSRLLSERTHVRRALLWADAAQTEEGRTKPPTSIWDVGVYDALWSPDLEDAGWLEKDLAQRNAPNERAIALSALIYLTRAAPDPEAALDRLETLVSGDPVLKAEMAEYRKPRPPSPKMIEHEKRMATLEAKRAKERAGIRAGWKSFRDLVVASPQQLDDSDRLQQWPGIHDLRELTRWLSFDTGNRYIDAAEHWRRLSAPFSPEVAQHYEKALRKLWRLTKPQRPKRNGSQTTTPWVVVLSCAGIELEAAADRDWAKRLSPEDAVIAAAHIILSDQGGADLVSDLLVAHPGLTEGLIIDELRREWASLEDHGVTFLNRCERDSYLTPAIRHALLELFRGRPPKAKTRLQQMHAILGRSAFTEEERASLLVAHRRRFASYVRAEAWLDAVYTLALLMEVRPREGVKKFIELIENAGASEKAARARQFFGQLFDVSHPAFRRAELLTTQELARLYRLTSALRPAPGEDVDKPEDPDDEDGEDFRGGKRNPADYAQHHLMRRLIARGDEEAYLELLRLADEEPNASGRQYLRRAARRMIERATDPAPWAPDGCLQFERKYTAPIKSGDDLFTAVLGVLDDIQFQFTAGDGSSRSVVETAAKEDNVQQWLFEQLSLRSKNRFLLHLEKQAAEKKRPDITVSAAQVEVAIEVKHGRKGWTLATLNEAVTDQLAERYLKPHNRRHGVLVITNHERGFWLDRENGGRLRFVALIEKLSELAGQTKRNALGTIELAVRGIDAAPLKTVSKTSARKRATAKTNAKPKAKAPRKRKRSN